MYVTPRYSPLSRLLLPFALASLILSGCINNPDDIAFCEDGLCDDSPGSDVEDEEVFDPAPTCTGNGLNGEHHCGGLDCEPCDVGMSCNASADCATDICVNGICAICNFDDLPFGGGEGTENSPFMLCSPNHLAAISEHLASHFQLATDLDLALFLHNPIGSDNDPFTGVFDGGGFEIQNLELKLDDDIHVGFFGAIGVNAQVSNLKFTDAAVVGGVGVGILAGKNRGTISNVHTHGEVRGTAESTGGLVGQNLWEINNSSSTASVEGPDSTGGLVGINETGIVNNSFATAQVSGDINIGGLVGANLDGIVVNSFAGGDVKGWRLVGGLVGANSSDGQIENTYSTGSVALENDCGGGLIGQHDGLFRRSYVYTVYMPDETAVSPLVGCAVTQSSTDPTPTPHQDSFWNGGYFCAPQDSTDSTNDAYPSNLFGKCLKAAEFADPDNFEGWFEHGHWKMSTQAGRPLLPWEEAD